MKSITKSMLLTLVLVFMSSVGWGIDPSCTSEEVNLRADRLGKILVEMRTGNKNEADIKRLEVEQAQIETRNKNCEKTETDKNTVCKDLKDQESKIAKDFPYSAQKQALKCLGMESNEDSADYGKAVLTQIGGSTTAAMLEDASSSICRAGAPKSDLSDQFEKKEKLIENYNEKIAKLEKEKTDKARSSQEKISAIEKKRIDLKKDFTADKKQGAENEQKALKAMKENQLSIQRQIRQADNDLVKAKLEQKQLGRKRDAKLSELQLRDSQSMIRQCNIRLEKYCKDFPKKCSKKQSSSLGAAISKGGNKTSDMSNVMSVCITGLEEMRNGVYEDFRDAEIQFASAIASGESSKSELQKQMIEQVKDYDTAVLREKNNMNEVTAAYFETDAQLAKDMGNLNQIAMKEQNSIQDEITVYRQKILGAQASLGEINEKEAELLLENSKEYFAVVEARIEKKCDGAMSGPDFENLKLFKGKADTKLQERSNQQ